MMLCIEDKREMDRGRQTVPGSRISLNTAGDSRKASPGQTGLFVQITPSNNITKPTRQHYIAG
jgi:hypothetical protein